MRRRLGRVLNIPHIELAVNFREVVPARQNQFRWWFCGQRRKIEHRFTLVADVKAECDPEPTHLNTSDLRLSHQRGTFTTEPIGLSVRSAFGFSVQRRQYCGILRSIGYAVRTGKKPDCNISNWQSSVSKAKLLRHFRCLFYPSRKGTSNRTSIVNC